VQHHSTLAAALAFANGEILIAAATATFDEAIEGTWDVIVVGAGPAGAVAARQLAAQGAATLLVERRAWPRPKVCGGCLNARAVSVLRTIGLGDVLNDARNVRLTQLTAQARRRHVAVALPGGIAMERSAFDAALVDAAVGAGAKFLPATKAIVDREQHPSAVRHVLLSSRGRRRATATARIVVAADGLGHPSLTRLPEFACRIATGARIGVSSAIEQMPATYREGVIYMAISRAGYVGLVRTPHGRGNLAAAIDASALRSAENPANAVAAILADAGLEMPRISTNDCWLGTLPLTQHANRLSAERIFLLGDAAGYVEPFSGEGIGWALSSAAAATPWIMRNLDSWDAPSIRAWEHAQRRQMSRDQAICRLLAVLLRKPLVVQMALGVLGTVPALARPFVRRIYQNLPASELRAVRTGASEKAL
jgi:flavin-dependent dehydrogenase